MATLSLHGLNIGLHVWLFSNHVIPNASFVSDPIPLPHEHQPHVNPSLSSLNVELTSLSSSSLVENSDVSKCAAKKKMKRKAKKKKTKQKVTNPAFDHHVGNPSATDHSAESVDFPTRIPCKPNFPCILCNDDHILKYWNGLSQFLEVCYEDYQHPMSLALGLHTDDTLSTSDLVVNIRKGKVKHP